MWRAVFFLLLAQNAFAETTPCDSNAFRDVVAKAGATLTDLQSKNTQTLQARLQQLRTANGWNEAEFATRASHLMKDEKIQSIDTINQSLLAQIQNMQGNKIGDTTHCAVMLSDLNNLMTQIVSNTEARWRHILAKAAEMPTAPLHAGAMR